ncbi:MULTISPECIES: bifunctional phosphoribosylaminoimidazolecarboxamide formyltransferase/IMP cyclohydrolase [unclassified Prochlorococcus]|uniref:bifunctional phosphoribosylaminoimidazolecarboxamide formyltransferase/IMP cyclohydrolase n=1 Tax=unclassified Prochlorococcus TaxID=2627481 RepID=UPI000533B83D|nr:MULTISPECIES: bifunctional phosphoribosylaminoimidazolecarboxamide formyltransferase/IMP cyclohydrolase [unclassified Prochlorococcus]KGG16662.1 IMP cyclohydrolase [Prochlorococcus sp. MIT 0602]KGG18366.1 IMP cyclohydrolase [Prochlorococcus sp. MIT 0603]
MPPIALLSVSNKQGLIPLAKKLSNDHGFTIISSGGTAKALEKEFIPVVRISDYTGAQEILGGRVKTLHPKVHGGILAKRNDESHQSDLLKHGINNIDLVIVNLYPFKETIANPSVSWEEAIENIDIGGPTMVRAAAKNHDSVIVLTSPNQYEPFLKVLSEGEVSLDMRKELALEAYEHTASYDIAISRWMRKQSSKEASEWLEAIPLKQTLRYGENPHQKASWYSSSNLGWGGAKQLQGKELSTNNLLDLEAAISTIREFEYGQAINNPSFKNASVVIKHTNPCGVAIGDSISIALKKSLDADPISAFGGIIALNSSVNLEAANQIQNLFLECVVAPDFDDEAKSVLSKKKNLRVIQLNKSFINQAQRVSIRSILGGLIIQESDDISINSNDWKVVTNTQPNSMQKEDLEFAWKVVRHVRSNAIAIACSGQTIGIGAGQMNRVGAAKIALAAAGDKANQAVLASDGFFPFDDTVRIAATHGIAAIIQPGGSIRDDSSIKACNELNISMIFTGQRHFLH